MTCRDYTSQTKVREAIAAYLKHYGKASGAVIAAYVLKQTGIVVHRSTVNRIVKELQG